MLGLSIYIVWDKTQSSKTVQNDSSKTGIKQTTSSDIVVQKTDTNAGYLVVREWGLRFKVPAVLGDVRYVINSDILALYAKPSGLKAEYVKDYARVNELGYPSLGVGVVYRSKEATKTNIDIRVDGKKLGEHYYYSAWSFSSLATGAACLPLYDIKNQEEQCIANNIAFKLVNSTPDGLIDSIELAL